jgi:hypothetical protein
MQGNSPWSTKGEHLLRSIELSSAKGIRHDRPWDTSGGHSASTVDGGGRMARDADHRDGRRTAYLSRIFEFSQCH